MAKADNPRAVEGDNSAQFNIATAAARAEIKAYVERVERLQDERSVIGEDIKDIFAEAKGKGYPVGAMRKAIARRKRDREEVREEDTMIEIIEEALGIFA